MKHYSIENRLELFQEPLREEAKERRAGCDCTAGGRLGEGEPPALGRPPEGKEGTHWREVGNNTQTQKEAQT